MRFALALILVTSIASANERPAVRDDVDSIEFLASDRVLYVVFVRNNKPLATRYFHEPYSLFMHTQDGKFILRWTDYDCDRIVFADWTTHAEYVGSMEDPTLPWWAMGRVMTDLTQP